MTPPEPRSAYVHVPFCRHRCGYCDFAVIAGRDDLIGPFLEALATELGWLGRPRPVDTLYFGGGTPTHLTPDALARLFDSVLAQHPLNAGAEWTVEANPEDVAPERLEVLVSYGVTRVSLGVQSFNDAKLRSLDRTHTRATAWRAAELVQAAGLDVSIDLIFAAPGETRAGWRQDLQDAIAAAPSHISTYGLTFETGAVFTAMLKRGAIREVDEELQRTMYAEAIDALAAAGFEHYEVSNFAQAGRRSRHNEVYWAGSEYFAAGPGAARYVDGVRQTNIRSTPKYIQRVLAGQSPVAESERLNAEQRARERLVLGLRRMQGVDKAQFAATSGYLVDELAAGPLAKLAALGLVEDDRRRVRLTREGLFVSDAIWPELL